MWFRYAPRKSCSRTSDDAMLARPVKDTDLLLLGSAHSVPWEDCFRRWQSMAWRVSNSLEQWAHLNPTAWIMLCCPAGRITHGNWSRLQCPGIWFLGELAQIVTKKLTTNDIQSICSVRRMPRAVSLAKWYRRNLQPQTCRVCQSLWERQLENDYIIHNKITIHALL
jgi:hypothetical protein